MSLINIIVFIDFPQETKEESDIPPPFYEIEAVEHEINNLSDLFIGFEFDNSTFTIFVDREQDTFAVQVIRSPYSPPPKLYITNASIFGTSAANDKYYAWIIRDVTPNQYITLNFIGKGRAKAIDWG